jgi:hypothetical protein
MEKESLTISIKTAQEGSREVHLSRMTLQDIELFQEVLTSFKNLLELYDPSCTIKVFEGSAAMQSHHESSVLNVLRDDLQKASNREIIRPGALKQIQTLQTLAIENDYGFEIAISRQNNVISLNDYFTTQKFRKPSVSKGRATHKVVFLQGTLMSLDESASISIQQTGSLDITKVLCESRLRARSVRNYWDSQVFLSAIKHETPKSGIYYYFIDNYSDVEQMRLFNRFYDDYHYHRNDDRYLFMIHHLDKILAKDESLDVRLKEIVKYIRLFDNDFTDEGQLFTILTSLQQFENEDILESVLSSMYEKLQKKTKMNF